MGPSYEEWITPSVTSRAPSGANGKEQAGDGSMWNCVLHRRPFSHAPLLYIGSPFTVKSLELKYIVLLFFV